jgi:hypothetical protein
MRPVVNLWLKCAMPDHMSQHDPRLVKDAPPKSPRRPNVPASGLTAFSVLARQPRYCFGPRPCQPGADDARIDCADLRDTS